MAHLFFNISGILLFYPIPYLRKLPLAGARFLGSTTAKYRWFAFVYLVVMFFLVPGIIFGLSLAGWQALVGVGVPVVLLIIFVVTIKIFQAKRPHVLPEVLQNWKFLPVWLRSLEPWDSVFTKVFCCCQTGKDIAGDIGNACCEDANNSLALDNPCPGGCKALTDEQYQKSFMRQESVLTELGSPLEAPKQAIKHSFCDLETSV